MFPFGFDYYCLFVVDPLHKIEIGIFKQIFTHLVQILFTQGTSIVARLDHR